MQSGPNPSIAPILLFMLFSMIPFTMYMFLFHNEECLEEKRFKTKYGALYLNYATHKRTAYSFNVWFLMRRLVYVLSLAGFFPQMSLINLLIQILMSIGLIMYVAVVMPFELKRDNWIEIMNESFILSTFYVTLGVIVNDYDMSGDMKYNLGYVIMGIVLFSIVVNFLIFMASLLQQLFTKLKTLLLLRGAKGI